MRTQKENTLIRRGVHLDARNFRCAFKVSTLERTLERALCSRTQKENTLIRRGVHVDVRAGSMYRRHAFMYMHECVPGRLACVV
jgi:hypothetical protein